MANILKKIIREPVVLLNRLYYELTGVSIKELQKDKTELLDTSARLAALAKHQSHIEVQPLSKMYKDSYEDADCKALGALFERYGSDKSTKHDYYLIYAALLKGRRAQPLSILEIGLGTNNINVPSNMGKDGKPGASLRAWRDWGAHFMVYGADVDRGILFSEDRIETFFVDQTNTGSLAELATHFKPASLDLIVDDGLHTALANLNTLTFALPLLTAGGYFVVEDIQERYIPAWEIALALLDKGRYTSQLIKAKVESVAVIQQR